eukprot:3822234-Rhodomonas_salina.1
MPGLMRTRHIAISFLTVEPHYAEVLANLLVLAADSLDCELQSLVTLFGKCPWPGFHSQVRDGIEMAEQASDYLLPQSFQLQWYDRSDSTCSVRGYKWQTYGAHVDWAQRE